ncbi:DUF1214 domain-containing protein [Nocardioides mangrovi]|uniref:DUF1214 domain-containing protein n=1 Tax=Nocardioides mangrovi TaxID=2874580 RepID=A0ABS7U8B8_9ACTN|nr:DUF1214 domain-containing protein [Nocardioides mangrovi]MBZ5737090.1 DUF1214 domain-containing protein [Nocardioides mangrovi]
MTDTHESTAAWHELLDGLRDLESSFLTGDRAVAGAQAVADGYRALATVLGVGLDTYLFPDPSRPTFVDVNTPFRRDRRWGGDNSDSWYAFVVLDPRRTYRVTGQRGDSVYFSITVYNEPSPGAWSDRVIGVVNDDDLTFDADGRFELMMGPRRPEGYDGAFVELAEDTAAAMTRDYQVDPGRGRRVTWEVEVLDEPGPVRNGDAETARALRSTLTWLRTMFAIVPLSVGVRTDDHSTLGHEITQLANDFGDPYRVPDFNFGWSATDACYSFGSYDLAEDEALVVTHRPPACRFWNVIIWNQFMAAHNLTDGRVSLNHGTAVPNADGTVTVVIARTQLEHPNAITTIDHARGNLAFRWFLADEVPATPEVRLVKAANAPTAVD